MLPLLPVLLTGFIVVFGIIFRIKTWGTPEFHRSFYYTVIASAMLGIGVIFVDQTACNRSLTFFLFSNPSVARSLHMYIAAVGFIGYFIYYEIRDNTLDIFSPIEWVKAACAGLAAVLLYTTLSNLDDLNFPVDRPDILVFSALVAVGAVHAVLGPIIACLNLAAVAKSVFFGGHIADMLSLASVLDIVGIENAAGWWVVFGISTGLGLRDIAESSGLLNYLPRPQL